MHYKVQLQHGRNLKNFFKIIAILAFSEQTGETRRYYMLVVGLCVSWMVTGARGILLRLCAVDTGDVAVTRAEAGTDGKGPHTEDGSRTSEKLQSYSSVFATLRGGADPRGSVTGWTGGSRCRGHAAVEARAAEEATKCLVWDHQGL